MNINPIKCVLHSRLCCHYKSYFAAFKTQTHNSRLPVCVRACVRARVDMVLCFSHLIVILGLCLGALFSMLSFIFPCPLLFSLPLSFSLSLSLSLEIEEGGSVDLLFKRVGRYVKQT